MRSLRTMKLDCKMAANNKLRIDGKLNGPEPTQVLD
jgi:hypothetical protein